MIGTFSFLATVILYQESRPADSFPLYVVDGASARTNHSLLRSKITDVPLDEVTLLTVDNQQFKFFKNEKYAVAINETTLGFTYIRELTDALKQLGAYMAASNDPSLEIPKHLEKPFLQQLRNGLADTRVQVSNLSVAPLVQIGLKGEDNATQPFTFEPKHWSPDTPVFDRSDELKGLAPVEANPIPLGYGITFSGYIPKSGIREAQDAATKMMWSTYEKLKTPYNTLMDFVFDRLLENYLNAKGVKLDSSLKGRRLSDLPEDTQAAIRQMFANRGISVGADDTITSLKDYVVIQGRMKSPGNDQSVGFSLGLLSSLP